VQEQLQRAWVPFLGLVAVTGAGVSNVVVLGLVATPVEVAIFTGAQRIIIALQTLVAPVSTALYPYASQKAGQGEAASIAFVKRYVGILAAPFLLAGVVLLVGSPVLLPWFLAEKYRESAVLQIMAMIPALFLIVQVYSTYYMLACGYDRDWRRITLTVTVFNLVLMVGLLSAVRGAHAIAWTALGSEVLAAFFTGGFTAGGRRWCWPGEEQIERGTTAGGVSGGGETRRVRGNR
jgi:PST family polysaccharide transporter